MIGDDSCLGLDGAEPGVDRSSWHELLPGRTLVELAVSVHHAHPDAVF
jgi:hypothetical protein